MMDAVGGGFSRMHPMVGLGVWRGYMGGNWSWSCRGELELAT